MRLRTFLLTFFVVPLVSSCGGGGGSSTGTTEPESQVMQISFIDSLPGNNASGVGVDSKGFSLVHTSVTGAEFSYQLDCDGLDTFTVQRSLEDITVASLDQLVDHKFVCPDGLTAETAYTFGVAETRADGGQLEGSVEFTAGTDSSSINVLLEKQSSREDVDAFFANYVSGALLNEIDLPSSLQLLILTSIIDLAESEWANLANPAGLYDVVSQRVQYGSMQPDGVFSRELTGLVAYPDVEAVSTFEKRTEVILLTHATGSTPSDLNESDAWYVLANLFAAQGYLVVAPDNYGRGGTAAFPETYLQANRTGLNAVALLSSVVEDPRYGFVFDNREPVNLNIIGYSQGGHSAIASWLEIVRGHGSRFQTRKLSSGGAPLNLYKTVRGVMQHIDGSCGGDGYCDLVDSETSVPFATDRILPALISYSDTGLTSDDVISEGALNPDFVSGFLGDDLAYDNVRILMQLGSFTNVVNRGEVFSDALVNIDLYHSEYDRLVPVSNTLEFASLLNGTVAMTLHEDVCNSPGFQILFESIDKVGVVHTICGLTVLDQVFSQLR
ncbi:MAG: hypothetical protein CMQ20_05660 [Gammaproteobacteria bacterium]|jgi:pimeloyl-ACP methyl ester carboxylesterase|nr:hypothetical protein [Gammaproteobacteria bacterium]